MARPRAIARPRQQAAPDRDTAQWSADSLGRSEVEEIAEGYSYGANTIRDGVSLTPRRELRALALPSEIMRLENLHGYLKFPGPLPVASIRLKYVARGAAAARFVPREGDAGPPADDAVKAIPGRGKAGEIPAADGATSDSAPVQGEFDLPPVPEDLAAAFAPAEGEAVPLPPGGIAGAGPDDGTETDIAAAQADEGPEDGAAGPAVKDAPDAGRDIACQPARPARTDRPARRGADTADPGARRNPGWL